MKIETMKQVDAYSNALLLARGILDKNVKINSLENALNEQQGNLDYLNEKAKKLDGNLYFVLGDTKEHTYQISYTIEECKELIGLRIARLKKQIQDIQQEIIDLAYKNELE